MWVHYPLSCGHLKLTLAVPSAVKRSMRDTLHPPIALYYFYGSKCLLLGHLALYLYICTFALNVKRQTGATTEPSLSSVTHALIAWVSKEVFGHQVRWILGTEDFAVLYLFAILSLLNP